MKLTTNNDNKTELEGSALTTGLAEKFTDSKVLTPDILFSLANWIELAIVAGNAKAVPDVIRKIAEICKSRGEE